jgi:hypothetical protein
MLANGESGGHLGARGCVAWDLGQLDTLMCAKVPCCSRTETLIICSAESSEVCGGQAGQNPGWQRFHAQRGVEGGRPG